MAAVTESWPQPGAQASTCCLRMAARQAQLVGGQRGWATFGLLMYDMAANFLTAVSRGVSASFARIHRRWLSADRQSAVAQYREQFGFLSTAVSSVNQRFQLSVAILLDTKMLACDFKESFRLRCRRETPSARR